MSTKCVPFLSLSSSPPTSPLFLLLIRAHSLSLTLLSYLFRMRTTAPPHKHTRICWLRTQLPFISQSIASNSFIWIINIFSYCYGIFFFHCQYIYGVSLSIHCKCDIKMHFRFTIIFNCSLDCNKNDRLLNGKKWTSLSCLLCCGHKKGAKPNHSHDLVI